MYRQYPSAHVDAPRLRARLGEIARDIRKLPVDYEQWQIVYRQALQLDRALDGQPQLLEAQSTSRDESTAPWTAAARETETQRRARSLPTQVLVREIGDKAASLARKEVELAKAEVKADLRSELGMAKGLGMGGLLVLLGVSLLPLAAAVALASLMPAWLAALVIAVVLLAAGAALGYRHWTRRVTQPLARTRRTLRETTRWAKELVGALARRMEAERRPS